MRSPEHVPPAGSPEGAADASMRASVVGEERWSSVAASPRRILVISYFFPPDGAVGGLRWGAITKYLARAEWGVEVLAAGTGEARPADSTAVRVHRVPRAATLNDAYRRRRARPPGSPAGARPPGEAPVGAGAGKVRRGILGDFRRALAVGLRYPDHSRGWVLRAARAARRIIRSERIDLMVSSGPPHTAHVVAMLAGAGADVPWVMDMRDPWSDMAGADMPPLLRWTTERLERMAFGRADAVVCNARQYAEDLRRRALGGSVRWIPNGIDLEDLPRPRPAPSGPLTLAYVGTLYFNRDLGPVLKSMAAFLHGGSEAAAAGVRLRFAGHADPEHAAVLERQLRESGVEPHVQRLGRISREAAREVVQEANIAIVLAQEQPMQVPAKLYESMGMGVHTLVLAEPGSAAASEAERIGALWKSPGDIEGIRAVFEQVAGGALPSRARAREPFDYRSIALDVAEALMAVER